MRSSLLLAATVFACTVHAQFINGVDPQWGGNTGLVTWNDGGAQKTRPLSALPRPDGKTLVVGTNYSTSNNVVSIFSTLLDATGRPVQSYGSHGTCNYVQENGHSFMGKLLLDAGMQSDGKAILLCWNAGNSTASIVRLRPDGEVDSTFATNGVIALGNLGAQCLAIQSGDRILLGGGANTDLFIRRYTANGQLDATYGTAGIYADPLSGTCFRLHGLPDGRWLVVGHSPGAVLILSEDGTPDASYGSNGHATSTLATGFLGPNDAALQPDGKILLSTGSTIRRVLADGATQDPVFPFNNNNFVGASQLFAATDGSWYYYFSGLVKMTAADVIDNTFGASGQLLPANGPTWINVLEGEPILMVGAMAAGGQQSNNGFAARYTADGQIDATWGVNSQAYFTGNDAWALGGNAIFDASGRIVVLGRPWNGNGCLARFTTDGQIDETFSTDGLVSLAQSNVAMSVTAQSSGQLVVAGFTTQGNGANAHVERFGADGAADGAYFQWLPFSPGLNQQRPTDAVTMPDDQVAVLANISDINSGSVQTTGVAMITTTGAVNTAFGNNGVFQQVQQGYEAAGSITLDLDGNILCAVAEDDGLGVFGITFYKLDPLGAPIASFGTNGFKHVALPTAPYGTLVRTKPLFLPDGRFYLGFDVHGNDFYGTQLGRFLATGDLDPSFSGDGLVETISVGVYGTPVLLSDGSIICPSAYQSSGEAYIEKFLPTGEVDLAFDTDGTLTISDPGHLSFATANAIANADDEVYISGVLGYLSGWNTSNFDPYLFHLAPDFNTSARGPANTGTDNGLVVYPSLVTDEFTVRLADPTTAKKVSAYDATGRSTPIQLVRWNANGATYRLSGQAAPGVYVVTATEQGKRRSARIVVGER